MFSSEKESKPDRMYIEEPPINESIERFFKEYCSIDSSALRDHFIKIRENAWKRSNYPCLGRWTFLHFSIQRIPIYSEIIDKCVNEGSTVIDFGCCLGQDVRQLIFDGVPIKQIRGYELDPFFIEQGYSLFCDEDQMKTNDVFHSKNIFDEQFLNNVQPADYVHVASFIHLFDLQTQKDVCHRLTRLSKRAIFGRQVGSTIPHERQRHSNLTNGKMMCHSPQSFSQMWNEVTNGSWIVQYAQLNTRPDSTQILTFVVRNTNERFS